MSNEKPWPVPPYTVAAISVGVGTGFVLAASALVLLATFVAPANIQLRVGLDVAGGILAVSGAIFAGLGAALAVIGWRNLRALDAEKAAKEQQPRS